MLTCLVPVLFTFYTQGKLKLKKNNSGTKGLIDRVVFDYIPFPVHEVIAGTKRRFIVNPYPANVENRVSS